VALCCAVLQLQLQLQLLFFKSSSLAALLHLPVKRQKRGGRCSILCRVMSGTGTSIIVANTLWATD
jgi:hypothetical protein